MKVAVYPGSFNPLHEGHLDVIGEALNVFDKVIVAVSKNFEKSETRVVQYLPEIEGVEYVEFSGFLVDYIMKRNETLETTVHAVIKGLRNGVDFEYEKSQQYWNEDLGMPIPTLYIIADRRKTHISSSAIRQINRIKGNY